MLAITEVRIKFSENSEINRIIKKNAYNPKNPSETIRLLERVDREVRAEGNQGYDKTDVTIVWENGDEYTMRYDIGDGESIAFRLSPEKHLKMVTDRLHRQGKVVPDYIKLDYEARIAFLQDKAIGV